MGDVSLVDVFTFLREGGVVAFLVFAVFGGWKRWWVHGWLYDQSQAEVAYWRTLALRALDVGEAAVAARRSPRLRALDDEDSIARRRPAGGDVDDR